MRKNAHLLISLLISSVLFSGCIEQHTPQTLVQPGTTLYALGQWTGGLQGKSLDFKWPYLAWFEHENDDIATIKLMVLDVTNLNAPIVKAQVSFISQSPSGPILMGDNVFWVNNSRYYLYNITDGTRRELQLEQPAVGIPHLLSIAKDGFISTYNLSTGEYAGIQTDALTLTQNIDSTIWVHQDSFPFAGGFNYSIWIYNRTSRQQKVLLQNLTFNENTGLTIACYQKQIIFNNQDDLDLYDIGTEEITRLAQHSRRNQSSVIGHERFITDIQFYGAYCIYTDVSNEWNVHDGVDHIVHYWCVNLTSRKKIELQAAQRISEDTIIGITRISNDKQSMIYYKTESLFT